MDTVNSFQLVVEKYVTAENDIETNQYFMNSVSRHFTNSDANRDYKVGELEQPYQGLNETRRFENLISFATKAKNDAVNEILSLLNYYPILNFKHTQTIRVEKDHEEVTYDFIFSKSHETGLLQVIKTSHV